MTLEEKREFIQSLIETVEAEIMNKTGKMPKNWDAKDLRYYVKESFSKVVWSRMRKSKYFNNDCLINNL